MITVDTLNKRYMNWTHWLTFILSHATKESGIKFTKNYKNWEKLKPKNEKYKKHILLIFEKVTKLQFWKDYLIQKVIFFFKGIVLSLKNLRAIIFCPNLNSWFEKIVIFLAIFRQIIFQVPSISSINGVLISALDMKRANTLFGTYFEMSQLDQRNPSDGKNRFGWVISCWY